MVARLLSLLRSVPVRVMLPALAITGGVFFFAAIADEVEEGDTRAIDEWVLKALRTGETYDTLIGPQWLKVVALDLTALGGYTLVTLIFVLILGVLLLQRWYGEALVLGVTTFGGLLFNTLLKALYERPRPDVVIHLVEVSSRSFPSGHAMIAAVFYPTLGVIIADLVTFRSTKRYVIALSMLLGLTVGLTRVLLGVHYPSDVLAGWVAGLTWALMCFVLLRIARSRGWITHRANV